MSTIRYIPSQFSTISSGTVPWTSGQAWVSGAITDWATAVVPSGGQTSVLLLNGFNISPPSNESVKQITLYVTGHFGGGSNDQGQISYQIYNGANLIGSPVKDTMTGGSFNAGSSFNAASSRRTIGTGSGVWGTNLTLTNDIISNSGFGIVVSGVLNQPPGVSEFGTTTTGTYRMASFAMVIEYEPTAILRNKGQSIIKLGESFRKM